MSDAVLERAVTGRELGAWDCGRAGPTLLLLGGMHGNEPAGVVAAQNLLARLAADGVQIAGRVVALAGNVAALARNCRYVDRDLNRGWSAAAIALLRERATRGGELDLLVEDREQLELLRRFEQLLATRNGPLVVLDLHTSSADGAPFLCLADTIDNRRLGLATGVPLILGIEETIDGASLEWFADRGLMGLAIEGGQHDDPASPQKHEGAIWRAMDHLDMLAPARAADPGFDISDRTAVLDGAVGNTPPIVEIVERRAISPADDFRMEPGFVNFQTVRRGDLLAHDRDGEIRAPRDALVLLPLYQALGEDGFFLGRTVRTFWLHLATMVRALRLDALVRFLPGVRCTPAEANTICVDPKVARWFVTEIFHLLGFRKRRMRGGLLTFTRRLSLPENARRRRS
ncbi:MAG: succinylglutamate desuccinylase/aspartoacylase family protein [Planctomycetes bacterium]|nr:succinylglutamate desuccinylase/aspartoacylase family protein [Planctomycetota bacterium]